MNSALPTRPSLLYKFLFVLMIPALVYFGALIVDLFVQPVPPHAVALNPVFALFNGLVIAPATLLVGLLIIRRVPGNVIGPMLVIFGMEIANIVLGNETSLMHQIFFGPFNQLGFRCLFLLPFFFPTGRMHPQRFEKWVILCWAIGLIIGLAGIFMTPQTNAPNALFTPALVPLYPLFDWISIGTNILLLIAGSVSMFLRYPAAGQIERLQLKWLAWGFSILVIISLTWVPLLAVLLPPFDVYYLFAQTFVYMFPALTIGNAVLRHRLWDIDIIIRRTLIYSVLTAIQGALYFGGVIFTQQLVRAFIGQSGGDIGIVLSTLLIAALFNPLRRRIQDLIDRRFYRRKYDAEKTLAAFSQSMRDEVDIETLKAQLIRVVNDTMQPDRIALWVCEPDRER